MRENTQNVLAICASGWALHSIYENQFDGGTVSATLLCAEMLYNCVAIASEPYETTRGAVSYTAISLMSKALSGVLPEGKIIGTGLALATPVLSRIFGDYIERDIRR
jgi:hypothetical protein